MPSLNSAVAPPTHSLPLNRLVLENADLCVKCGLCLPHCPTYTLRANEAESPRGRIALMQGLAAGWIELTPATEAHLDHCLSCRSCETACPARVPYGQLAEQGQALMRKLKPARHRSSALIADVVVHARGLAVLLGWLRVLAWSGLPAWVTRWKRWTPRLAHWASLLPPYSALRTAPPSKSRSTSRSTSQSTSRSTSLATPSSANAARPVIQLFHGCLGKSLESQVIADFTTLLEQAGYAVEIPESQRCCGALHLHAGLTAPLPALHATNVQAFQCAENAPIAALATGCAVGLHDTEIHLAAATALQPRLRELPQLLHSADIAPHFNPLPQKVAIQVPCTQRNRLGGIESWLELLRRIPGIELEVLKSPYACCGAAGTHFIREPEAADAFATPLLEALKRSQATILVSANIGCRLHLAAAARRAQLQVEILHPATLLARQLQD